MIEPILEGMAQTECDREEPILRAGNTNCGGCGMSLVYQMLSRAVGTEFQIQLVIPACCGIVTPGRYPFSAYGAPVVASTFASAASFASGMAQVAQMNGENTRVIAFAGDGGTYDIGMATVSAAAERNEDVLYICYDNEIYGNTGGQRSSATPVGASTTTTPTGEVIQKKDILGIMAAHRIPYAASINLADPEDTMRKMKHALETRGFRFLQVMAPCPTGWKSEGSESIELIRLAIKSGLFPVIEIFDGRRFVINIEPEMCDESLERYISSQGRFKRSGVSVATMREGITATWEDLRARVKV
jgi:pyruvate/2-oxoacid:ferredoxin oxidoreductase beta subunit